MIRWFTLYFVITLWYVPSYARRAFGGLDYQQLVFFGTVPGVTTGTEWDVYVYMFKWLIVRPCLLIVFIYGCYKLTKLMLGARWRTYPKISWIVIFSLGALGINNILDSVGYYEQRQLWLTEDNTSKYFVDYPEIFANPEKKNNLVMIYVESLENTFGETHIFGNNLNAPLRNVFANPALDIQQVGGTTWTMAGLVASQCGVPLATFLGNKTGYYTNEMLPNLTCLGDVLSDNGYIQSFLVGTDVKFSGMDKFYKSHGYDSVRGQLELKNLHVNQNRTGWGAGLQDDTLLDIAFDEILNLKMSEQPFNITVVLTDNHAPDGYLSPRCKIEGFAHQLHEVVHCTNATVEKFIKKLRKENILDNTVVVVMGDHLFMGDFPEELNGYDRSVYFNYLTADNINTDEKIDKMSHFDVYPTVLSLTLGIDNPVLHLGVNLLPPYTKAKTQLHEFVFGQNYQPNSELFRKFWYAK